MRSHEQGLIDTSVIIDLSQIQPEQLPRQISIAAISLAELAAGPHATDDPIERAIRQERLQRVEAEFTAIPFDHAAARAYGRVYAAAIAAGRSARTRIADYLIAATAIAAGLPIYTRNPNDLAYLEHLVDVAAV